MPTTPSFLTTKEQLHTGPYIIGATGGSGTRVVARIVRRGGLYIGSTLNGAEDALDFSEYFDRWITLFMQSSNGWTNPSPAIQTDMSRDLHAILEKHCASLKPETRAWGWKAPRSMYLLPFWHQRFPRFKFLHVVRDGRDIAYSTNQNQLRKHGGVFLTSAEAQWSQPCQSIAMWSRINLLTADYGEQKLRGQYLRIRFEDLCAAPLPTIQRILNFFGLEGNVQHLAEFEVRAPESLGRWHTQERQTVKELRRIGAAALARFCYELS